MHPGADPVSGKRLQEDSFASRVRQAHVTRQSEKADSLLRRVEPRILSSLREESIRFFRVGSEPCGSIRKKPANDECRADYRMAWQIIEWRLVS